MACRAGGKSWNRISVLIVFLCSLQGAFFSCECFALDAPAQIKPITRPVKGLQVMVGKSVILKSSVPVKQVSMADPKVADYFNISPHQIYILGKAPGITNLTLWGKSDQVIAIYDLHVKADLSQLKEQLHQVLPGETRLRVSGAPDSIILSGMVSSSASLSQAVDLVKAFAPKNKVVNLVQVGGVQQVMLEVEAVEKGKILIKVQAI